MDLHRLRTLRELAQRKTMAAVAEAFLVSPSAVSQQITLLEAEAGMPLVERRGRGVRLTPAGMRLVQHADRVISILEEARTDLAELKNTVAGELRVAAFPSVAAALIPPTLREMTRLFPELHISFDELEPVGSLAALRAWQTDVAIVDDLTTAVSPQEGSVEVEPLLDDCLCVLLPKVHPLADRPHIELGELRGESWALDSAASTYANVMVDACRAAGFEPRVNARCNSFEVVRSLVLSGCSLSLTPRLRAYDCGPGLVLKETRPRIVRQISIAYRRGETRNPSIAAFIARLHEAVSNLKSTKT